MNGAVAIKETYWSRFATDYKDRNLYVVGKPDMDLFRRALHHVGDLGRALELACGNGLYSDVIASNAALLVATDFSEPMVLVARERLKACPNTVVEKADGLALPYESRSFDTVFAANLLHVIGNPEAILAEAGRVLKKGGRIVTLDLTMKGMKLLHKTGMAWRYLKTYGKPPVKGGNLSVPQVQQMFLRAGFDIERADLIGGRSKAVLMIGRKTSDL